MPDIDITWSEDAEETMTKCRACPAGAGSGATRYEAVPEMGPNVWRKIPCTWCGGEGAVRASSAWWLHEPGPTILNDGRPTGSGTQ